MHAPSSAPALRSMLEGNERIGVLEHDLAHDPLGALARAEGIFELALFEPGDDCSQDHAAVAHYA